MKKVPFGALTMALAGLATALGFLAIQLRTQGYEPYVRDVTFTATMMYFTAIMTVVTWFRARGTHSS
ncbi:SCO3870 family protein [Streptomyces sp. NPDC048434]|uniref:SCO3870 family protein n=1 Tax=Streptomyces sp. NPDC048434 TaxID=3365549 RepID=UPI003718C430